FLTRAPLNLFGLLKLSRHSNLRPYISPLFLTYGSIVALHATYDLEIILLVFIFLDLICRFAFNRINGLDRRMVPVPPILLIFQAGIMMSFKRFYNRFCVECLGALYRTLIFVKDNVCRCAGF